MLLNIIEVLLGEIVVGVCGYGGRGRVITVARPYEPKLWIIQLNATPFKCSQTMLWRCRRKGPVGVSKCHFMSFTLRKIWIPDDYFITASIPAILPSRILFLLNCFLSTVSHLEPEGHIIESSAVRCICLTFYGSSKGCTSPKFRGICRMCPVVKRRSVWVQEEILQMCCSF